MTLQHGFMLYLCKLIEIRDAMHLKIYCHCATLTLQFRLRPPFITRLGGGNQEWILPAALTAPVNTPEVVITGCI